MVVIVGCAVGGSSFNYVKVLVLLCLFFFFFLRCQEKETAVWGPEQLWQLGIWDVHVFCVAFDGALKADWVGRRAQRGAVVEFIAPEAL